MYYITLAKFKVKDFEMKVLVHVTNGEAFKGWAYF